MDGWLPAPEGRACCWDTCAMATVLTALCHGHQEPGALTIRVTMQDQSAPEMQPLLSPRTGDLRISAWRWFCSLNPPGVISQGLLLVEDPRLTPCFPTENTALLCACSKTPQKERRHLSKHPSWVLSLTPPFTSLFIHAGTALQAPAPCPGGLPSTRTLPPAPRSRFSAVPTDPKVAANSPSVDGDTRSSLSDLLACTSGSSPEHCCPAPPRERAGVCAGSKCVRRHLFSLEVHRRFPKSFHHCITRALSALAADRLALCTPVGSGDIFEFYGAF